MKVAISSLSSRDDSLISKIKKILDDENIDSEIIKRSDKVMTSNVDIVITAGGDQRYLIIRIMLKISQSPYLESMNQIQPVS